MKVKDKESINFQQKTIGDISFISGTYDSKNKQKIHVCFTNRSGGFSKKPFNSLNLSFRQKDARSAVKKNWQKLLKNLLSPPYVLFPEQIHGNKVSIPASRKTPAGVLLNKPHLAVIDGADGVVTSQRFITLAALFADCIPVVLFDRDASLTGVLHAGWRGTFEKISQRGVAAINETLNTKTSNLFAVIGPGIGGCCYHVGKEFLSRFKDYPEAFAKAPLRIDLKKINRQQLIGAGLPEDNIHDVDVCTYCDPARHDMRGYFSYRRDNGLTGRQAAITWIDGG